MPGQELLQGELTSFVKINDFKLFLLYALVAFVFMLFVFNIANAEFYRLM